jgi:hypothetical protein
VEATPSWWVYWARKVPAEDDPLSRAFKLGVRHRHCGEERLGVRVERVGEQRAPRAKLDDFAKVHDGNAVAYLANHREVVADDEESESELVLEFFEQVQDLSLHGNIERAHGLVSDDEFWLEDKCSCDVDSLTLSAAESVRVPIDRGDRESD